ncbi:hypothetical protein ACJDT4_21150 [Clostridium neuense]|uniref:Uncharacterized protein n=1 Tax=Clostridium neuense TaxID=1728934 RepID=A0ABW8TK20_9CLOT
MISVDFEKLKELYEIVNRFEGTVSENLSRAEAQTSGITASGDRLLCHLNETKQFLDDEISRYQNLERKLNEKANAITFRGSKALNAVYINNISENIQVRVVNANAEAFIPLALNGDAALESKSSELKLKSENAVDKTLKAADEKVDSTIDMVKNTANELKNFAEEKIEDVDKAIKNAEEYIKSELSELTRQINSVLEEIFKTFENKNFQKAGTDFLVLLAFKSEELTTSNKSELKVLPKFESECENNLSNDFDNFKADVWNEFSKNHPGGAKLLRDTSNKINDLEGIIKKSWELYKKIDPKHAGILAGACTFAKETVEIPYDAAEFCGKQWYNLRTDTKGTLLNWLDTGEKIYGLLNPQIPKTAEQLEFEGNLLNSIKNSVDKNLINGDEYTRAKFGTEVVLNIATLFSGKGVLKAASEADKVENVVRLSKDASEMSKLEKGTSYAEKMSELSSKLKGLGKVSEEMFKNTLNEILSLQKSITDRFGGIAEKLKSIDKEVEIRNEAKEIAETAKKSEVEEKTVNDIIIEKNEIGSPAKVDEDIKKVNVGSDEEKIETDLEKVSDPKSEQLKDVKDSGANEEINTKADEAKVVGENSKVDSKNAEEVNVESKTDEVAGKEGAKGVSEANEDDLDTSILDIDKTKMTDAQFKQLCDVAKRLDATPENAIKIGSEKTWSEFLAANSSTDLNKSAESYIKLITEQSPWPEGYTPVITTLKGGEQFNMVLNADAELDELGGWGLIDDVPDIKFVNSNMGVKSNWKTNLGKVVRCEVNDGVTLNAFSGPIGPQVDLAADTYLPGDLSLTQLDLFNGMGKIERTDYIHAISGSEIYLK